jgi:hypothetical protein
MSSSAHLTECGLPGIKDIPYGVHMCHFYQSRQDLAAALVPYFAAGLRNNERGIWVTAEPLDAAGAKLELQKAGLDVETSIRRGALTIRDYSEWYCDADTFNGDEVVDFWLTEEQRAVADGYNGLRITGNVTFVTPDTWPAFMEYEETVNNALQGRRIVTLCTYRLSQSGVSEILDVVRRHHCTLDHPDHGWQLLTEQPSGALAPRKPRNATSIQR